MKNKTKLIIAQFIYIFGLLFGTFLFIYGMVTESIVAAIMMLVVFITCTEIYNRIRKKYESKDRTD